MTEQIQAAPAAIEQDVAADPWSQVEDACSAALSLSHEVRGHVEEGVDAHELVPLLHRQREAVTQLQSALGELVSLPRPAQQDRRDQLGEQLRELLSLHDTSIDSLSSRGVRLHGGRIR